MSGPRESRIPAGAATDRRLVGIDLQLICLLGRHTDRNGFCTRSQNGMAAELGCHRTTVIRSLARIEALGYLEVQPQTGSSGGTISSRYRLQEAPRQVELFEEGGVAATLQGGVALTLQGGVAPDATGGVAPGRYGPKNDDLERDPSLRSGPGTPERRRSNSKPKSIPGQRELIPAHALPPPAPPVDFASYRATPGVTRADRERGSRLPALWEPSDTDRAYAIRHGLSPPEVDRAAEEFRNYWHARPGRDGRKCDWSATWRNRILKLEEQREAGNGRGGRRGRGAEGDRAAGESALGAAARKLFRGGDDG